MYLGPSAVVLLSWGNLFLPQVKVLTPLYYLIKLIIMTNSGRVWYYSCKFRPPMMLRASLSLSWSLSQTASWTQGLFICFFLTFFQMLLTSSAHLLFQLFSSTLPLHPPVKKWQFSSREVKWALTFRFNCSRQSHVIWIQLLSTLIRTGRITSASFSACLISSFPPPNILAIILFCFYGALFNPGWKEIMIRSCWFGSMHLFSHRCVSRILGKNI